jgi:hypothetical protein
MSVGSASFGTEGKRAASGRFAEGESDPQAPEMSVCPVGTTAQP